MWGIWFDDNKKWLVNIEGTRITFDEKEYAKSRIKNDGWKDGIVKRIPETPITCYGVRGKDDKDGWLMDINGVMFWTVSKAVAQARLKLCNNDKVEVAEFIEENNP